MLISLAVRLIIPDTTSVSAARALRQAGLRELGSLRREVCWEFETDDDTAPEDLASRLLTADVLVNYNKHRGRWWLGTLEACPESAANERALRWAALLVEDRDNAEPARMQRLLTGRLGFSALRVRRNGTLWWTGVDPSADAGAVADRTAATLLVNRHGQRGRVLAPDS